MAIGTGSPGAWAAVNATTQTVTLPGHAAGNLLIVIAACKAVTPASLNIQITTPATGWTRLASFANGTTTTGTGVGSVTQAIFYKVASSAAETNPVVTWGGSQTATPGIALGIAYSKTGGSEVWREPVVVQSATNAATSISVTMGSNPGITAGDLGVIAHTTADDSALTVPTWSATGATLGTVSVTPVTPIATTTSDDMAGTAASRLVTSGTASAAPVVTGTQAAAETGVTCFIRLRVATVAAVPGSTIYLTDTASDVSTASVDREAWTSRGAAAQTDVTNTATGPTSPIQLTDTAGGTVVDWYTRPLAAFTLGGEVWVRLQGSESNAAANATLGCEIAVVDGDGSSPTVWASGAHPWYELGGSPFAEPYLLSAADVAMTDGQRVRLRVFIDDAAVGAMTSGFTATLNYAGTLAGGAGDSYLTFTQTLTEGAAVAATPPYVSPYPSLLAQ